MDTTLVSPVYLMRTEFSVGIGGAAPGRARDGGIQDRLQDPLRHRGDKRTPEERPRDAPPAPARFPRRLAPRNVQVSRRKLPPCGEPYPEGGPKSAKSASYGVRTAENGEIEAFFRKNSPKLGQKNLNRTKRLLVLDFECGIRTWGREKWTFYRGVIHDLDSLEKVTSRVDVAIRLVGYPLNAS